MSGSHGEVDQGSNMVAECCAVAAFGSVFVIVTLVTALFGGIRWRRRIKVRKVEKKSASLIKIRKIRAIIFCPLTLRCGAMKSFNFIAHFQVFKGDPKGPCLGRQRLPEELGTQ